MGLLSGSVSVTRFNVAPFPGEPDFEQEAFFEIEPGSEVRERAGFVPMEPGAPYQAGERRFAFRVRIDKLKPDPTAVSERHKQLVQSELEATGLELLGTGKRKELRRLAEEEILIRTTPVSRILECCLDGGVLYVASTAKGHLGQVMALLRKVGVVVEHKAPWIDRGDPELESEIVETHEPGESVLGCRFLKTLVGDREVMIEGEAGYVQLKTAETRITLAGSVLPDLHRYLKREAEILSAKIVTADASYRFDALAFRLSGLTVPTGRHAHWTDLLDERLEKIAAAFAFLDAKYEASASRLWDL